MTVAHKSAGRSSADVAQQAAAADALKRAAGCRSVGGSMRMQGKHQMERVFFLPRGSLHHREQEAREKSAKCRESCGRIFLTPLQWKSGPHRKDKWPSAFGETECLGNGSCMRQRETSRAEKESFRFREVVLRVETERHTLIPERLTYVELISISSLIAMGRQLV